MTFFQFVELNARGMRAMDACSELLHIVKELEAEACPTGFCSPSPELDALFRLVNRIKEVCSRG